MTRAEHLAWCKRRALAYVEAGDIQNAFASMASDLGKHPETASQVQILSQLGLPLLLTGFMDGPKMKKFIEDFN